MRKEESTSAAWLRSNLGIFLNVKRKRDRLRWTYLGAHVTLTALRQLRAVRVEFLGAGAYTDMAVDAFCPQTLGFVDSRSEEDITCRDQRGQSTYRTEFETPASEGDDFYQNDRRIDQKSPGGLIILEQMPESDTRRKGQTDWAK